MTVDNWFKLVFFRNFVRLLERRLKDNSKQLRRAQDALAYAKAMTQYHQDKTALYAGDKKGILENKLNLLEVQEAVDYAEVMIAYHQKRDAALTLLLNDNKQNIFQKGAKI